MFTPTRLPLSAFALPLLLLAAFGSSACAVTTHETYDARYASLMPAPQGPVIVGPSLTEGAQGVGLGLFSGFGGQSRGTIVGGRSGNISTSVGGRMVAKVAVLDELEVAGAFSLRPGTLGIAVASDTPVEDFKSDVALSATFASRWWLARGSFASIGVITELAGDLVPHRSRTVIVKEQTTGTVFGATTNSSTEGERHFGFSFYPKLRAGPVVQIQAGSWLVLTGGATLGNEVLVTGRRTTERDCKGVLFTTCDAARTPEAPDSRQTLGLVPFFAPSFRLDDHLTILVQVHAVLGDRDVSRPSPFGAEAGLIFTL